LYLRTIAVGLGIHSILIRSKSLWRWYVNRNIVSGHYPSSCFYLNTDSWRLDSVFFFRQSLLSSALHMRVPTSWSYVPCEGRKTVSNGHLTSGFSLLYHTQISVWYFQTWLKILLLVLAAHLHCCLICSSMLYNCYMTMHSCGFRL
jgi:hypothetical protein